MVVKSFILGIFFGRILRKDSENMFLEEVESRETEMKIGDAVILRIVWLC